MTTVVCHFSYGVGQFRQSNSCRISGFEISGVKLDGRFHNRPRPLRSRRAHRKSLAWPDICLLCRAAVSTPGPFAATFESGGDIASGDQESWLKKRLTPFPSSTSRSVPSSDGGPWAKGGLRLGKKLLAGHKLLEGWPASVHAPSPPPEEQGGGVGCPQPVERPCSAPFGWVAQFLVREELLLGHRPLEALRAPSARQRLVCEFGGGGGSQRHGPPRNALATRGREKIGGIFVEWD